MELVKKHWLVRAFTKAKRKKPRVAHIWLGKDTACRMASTGGLNMKRYRVSEDREGLQVCTMCAHVAGILGADDAFENRMAS